jgi:hypothetical protein
LVQALITETARRERAEGRLAEATCRIADLFDAFTSRNVDEHDREAVLDAARTFLSATAGSGEG